MPCTLSAMARPITVVYGSSYLLDDNNDDDNRDECSSTINFIIRTQNAMKYNS